MGTGSEGLSKVIKSKGLKVFVIVMALILIILTLLPFVVRESLLSVLKDMGASEASIENIDLNLFAGTFSIDQLSITYNDYPPAKLGRVSGNLSMTALFNKQILVQDFSISDLSLTVTQDENKQWVVGLPIPLVSNEPSTDSGAEDTASTLDFGLDAVSIRNSKIRLVMPNLESTLTINTWEASSIYSWLVDAKSNISLDGSFNNDNYRVDILTAPLSQSQSTSATIVLEALSLNFLQTMLADQFSVLTGVVSVNTKVNIAKDPAGLYQLENEGGLKVSNLVVAPKNENAKLSLSSLAWTGKEKVSIGVDNHASVQGSLLLSGFTLGGKEKTIESNKVVTIKTTHFKNISLDTIKKRLTLNTVEVSGSQINLLRDKTGTWLPSILGANSGKKSTKTQGAETEVSTQESDTQSKKTEFDFSINKVTLTGKNIISLKDEAVAPVFARQFSVEKFLINNLSNGDSSEKTDISVKIKEHQYGLVTLEGTVQRLFNLPSGEIKTKISGVELAPLSPYASGAIGYHINSGQLSLDSSIRLDKGNIDAKNTIDIDQLDMEAQNQEVIDKLGQKLTMPVETAVSLLKNGDGDIVLDVPIQGDIKNPNIKFGDAIDAALFQAVKGAAFNYMVLAIQPYGAILMAAQEANEYVDQLQLPAFQFQPGEKVLQEAQGDYLDKVAVMLNSRPDLRVKLCPYATGMDKIVLARPDGDGQATQSTPKVVTLEQLSKLAQARVDLIKGKLISNYDVKIGQLIECRPLVDEASQLPPKVELII